MKDYFLGDKQVERDAKRIRQFHDFIEIKQATAHNLKNIDVSIPIGGLTAVCGISGSGKSTLIHDILAKRAAWKLNGAKQILLPHGDILGLEGFDSVIQVDQSPIGKSPAPTRDLHQAL